LVTTVHCYTIIISIYINWNYVVILVILEAPIQEIV
jgi:hypothetical protein